jgi:uncharacterized protein (UPF0335 family)
VQAVSEMVDMAVEPGAAPRTKTDVGGIAADQLRSFIERIERLDEEKKALQDDIKEVMGEAKSSGFDTKIIRRILALRKKEEHERLEEEQLLDLYKTALGMN